MKILNGLDRLVSEKELQKKLSGNIGYICHQGSVDKNFMHGVQILKALFGKRLCKLFGPQHGFLSDLQDNMIESDHFYHPYFCLPIYSLYHKTRKPTPKMLEGLDHMVVDLQDVGTRVYTFISTLTLVMEACGKAGIEIFVLDRPNPIGGKIIEGNILDPKFSSFVGRHPLPMRHGLTIGEMALWAQKFCNISCELTVIPMKGYRRDLFFHQTDLPWVPPSPNVPHPDTAFCFVGSVLFEGTNLSEGRGTTRPLEMMGYPEFDPWKHLENLKNFLGNLTGFILRPCHFQPTFQKYAQKTCGGYHIHITDYHSFRPWLLNQYLCQYFYQHLDHFSWKKPPYEYEYEILPIDLINGSDEIRLWIEKNGDRESLLTLEKRGVREYKENKASIEIYQS